MGGRAKLSLDREMVTIARPMSCMNSREKEGGRLQAGTFEVRVDQQPNNFYLRNSTKLIRDR